MLMFELLMLALRFNPDNSGTIFAEFVTEPWPNETNIFYKPFLPGNIFLYQNQ